MYIPFVSTVLTAEEPYGEFLRGVQSRRFDADTGVGTIGGMIMAVPLPQGSKLLTVTEAAEVAGCTTGYLRRLLRGKDPRIVGIPAGPRAWLIDASCLEQFRGQLTSRSRGKRPAPKPRGRGRKGR